MAVLCLFPDTPWPWPTPSRAASARCGKSGRQASRRPEEANTWSCTELFPSPCARQERRSSAGLVSLLGAERENCVRCCSCRRGVAGRSDLPAEVGGGGPKGRRQGGDVIPLAM